MTFTPAHSRAARALIGWSQDQLAAASKVAKATIANFETGKRDPYPRTLDDLRQALEEMGVEFSNGGHTGVRVRWPTLLALKSLAGYVAQYADGTASTRPRTGAQKSAVKAQVEDACAKLIELADASRERQIKYAEFETLLRKLHKLGAFPTEQQVSAVALSFQVTQATA